MFVLIFREKEEKIKETQYFKHNVCFTYSLISIVVAFSIVLLTCSFKWVLDIKYIDAMVPFTNQFEYFKFLYFPLLFVFYSLMLAVMEERFYHKFMLDVLGTGIGWHLLVNLLFAAKIFSINYFLFPTIDRWWEHIFLGNVF